MLERVKRLFASAPTPDPKEDATGAPDQVEIGAYGSQIYRYGAFSQYNPDDLISNKGSAVYKKMMRDDQVKSANRFKRVAVASRKWFFKVDPENPEHAEQGRVLLAIVDNMRGSFQGALIGILSDTINGHSITEKVWKPIKVGDKSYWGIRNLKLRPFDTFDFSLDIHGNIEGVRQRVQGQIVDIPLNKIIHSVHQADIDEVYGESDLRACYRDWWSKDVIIKLRNIFLERYASGFPIAKGPAGLSASQLANLKAALNNISSNTSLIVPDSVNFDNFDPKSTTAYDDAIKGCNIAIAKSQLMPNLLGLSEQGGVGSYGQSQTQFEAFLWVLDEIARRLEETLNEQLFKQLAIWNFGTEDFPRFTFEPMSDAQRTALLALWSDMVSKGAVKRTFADENHIRRLIGFPEVEEEEDPEEPTPVPPIPPEDGNPMPGGEDVPEDEAPEDAEDLQVVENTDDCGCKARKYTESPWLKRVNFKAIDDFQNEQSDDYAAEFLDISGKVEQAMIDSAMRIWGNRSGNTVDPLKIESLEVPKSLKASLRRTTRMALESTFKRGVSTAYEELPKVMAAKVIRSGLDKLGADRYLAAQSFRITGDYSDAVVKAVQGELMNGVKFDRTLAQITQAIQDIAIFKPGHAETIARTSISDAYNQARLAAFNDPDMDGFVTGYEYSAILDGKTSEVCDCLDGKTAKDFGDRTPPNHFNCRSLLIPITELDEVPSFSDAASIARCTPQSGFGG